MELSSVIENQFKVPTTCESQITVSSQSPSPDHDYAYHRSQLPFIKYNWRWLVLSCYCLLSLSAGSSWLCFPAVSNIIRKYYNVGLLEVNMLSITFGFSIVIFSIPFGMVLDKFGLAVVIRVSAFLNFLGAGIRYFGNNEAYGYWFLLVGNTMTAISVAGFLFLPGKIAVSWFGKHEMGKATSICVGFDALGTGVGFLHATRMIRNSENMLDIQNDMKYFLLSQLIPAGFVFVFVLVFVRKQPKTPPNMSELEYQNQLERLKQIKDLKNRYRGEAMPAVEPSVIMEMNQNLSLKTSIIGLLKNFNFQLIIHMQGITASIEGIFELLLNEMLIELYPGMEQNIGIVGFVSICLGFAGNILIGIIVDKTGSCKKVSVVIFSLSLLSCAAWYILMRFWHSFIAQSVVFCVLMSTITSYYTIAFTHSSEVLESFSPSAVGVLLVLTSQIYDTISSVVATEILEHFGSSAVNFFAIILSFVALFLSFLIRKKMSGRIISFDTSF